MLTIERCEKCPGIFTGPKSYRLVLDANGLYVTELGKVSTTNQLKRGVSDELLHKKAMKQFAEQTTVKDGTGWTNRQHAADTTRAFFIRKDEMKKIRFNKGIISQLNIRSQQLRIKLCFTDFDAAKAELIADFFNG